MIAETIREVASWLLDAATGYEVVKASFPGAVVLPQVRMFDGATDAWAARGQVPKAEVKSGPLLIVRVAVEMEASLLGEDGPDASVPIAIEYAAMGDETHAELEIGYGVLRCVHRVINQKFAGASDPDYIRDRVFVQRPTRVTYLPLLESEDDTVIALALLMTIPVHDPWALGA